MQKNSLFIYLRASVPFAIIIINLSNVDDKNMQFMYIAESRFL